MLLSQDGELKPTDQLPAESPQDTELPDKAKRGDFNSPPVILWGRPFPDRGGYDAVQLFVDREGDRWGYAVMLRYHYESDPSRTWNRMLYGHGLDCRESAINAGIAAYEGRLNEIEAAKQEKKPVSIADWILLAGVGNVIVGVLFMALDFLAHWTSPEYAYRNFVAIGWVLTAIVCFIGSWSVVTTKPDPR